MPFALEQLSQALSIPGAEIDPVSQAAGTVLSGAVDMSKFQRVMFLLQVGSVGAAGTVDAKIQAAATSGGAYADVAGTNITQITASNKVATLEIRADQLPAGKQFVKLSVTVGGNAVLISAVPLGAEAEYKPASRNDIAAVTQRLVA